MSLDIDLNVNSNGETLCVYDVNITHNLNKMAQEAELYYYVWRPDELCIKKAGELVIPLSWGLNLLKADPDRFRILEPANKWGTYDGFVQFIEEYLQACLKNPHATISVSR